MDIGQDKVITCATCHEHKAALLQLLRQDSGIGHHLLSIGAKSWLERLAKGHCLGGNRMHMRPTLDTRKDCPIDQRRNILECFGWALEWVAHHSLTNDQPTTRPTQRLVCRRRHNMKAIIEGVLRHSTSNQPRDMRHIGHEQSANLVANRRKACKIQLARIGTKARQDDLRLMFLRHPLQLIVVNLTCSHILHLVTDEIILAGTMRHGRTMRQVATMTQIHREDGIAWLAPCKIHCFIRLSATVRLDISMVSPEELLGAVNRQLLYLVGILLPPIIAPARVTLAIFISKDTPKRP